MLLNEDPKERFDINDQGKIQNLLLTMETERFTFVLMGTYNYLQYKVLKCG